MTRTRLRSATATTPASRTSENKPDTMSSPPSISSTKGAQTKKRASAIKSCTVEKRRNLKRPSIGFVEYLGCVASFIHLFHDRVPHIPGFIDRNLPFVLNPSNLCNAQTWKARNRFYLLLRL